MCVGSMWKANMYAYAYVGKKQMKQTTDECKANDMEKLFVVSQLSSTFPFNWSLNLIWSDFNWRNACSKLMGYSRRAFYFYAGTRNRIKKKNLNALVNESMCYKHLTHSLWTPQAVNSCNLHFPLKKYFLFCSIYYLPLFSYFSRFFCLFLWSSANNFRSIR